MNDKIHCNNCDSTFTATDPQQKFIRESERKDMNFIMLECSECGLHTDFNPSVKRIDIEEKSLVWRTPIPKVYGFVSYIEDDEGNFYGCGATGQIWSTKKVFYSAIENIIKQFPHREKCYVRLDGEWLPNENEPENMDILIANEV